MPTRRPLPRSAVRTVVVGDRSVLALTAGAPGTATVGVHLVMPGLQRLTDVTFHPAAARARLVDVAARRGISRQEATRAVRAVLAEAAGDADAWEAPADAPLVTALGGAAHPMLAAAYARGAGPLEEVPRWATPALTATSARSAAVAAFGSAASRPVVAALAHSLTRGQEGGSPVHLGGLALGMIGADALGSDRLARVVDAPGPPTAPEALPDRALLALGRQATRRWGPVRTERVLLEAAATDGGATLLAATIRYAADLGDHGPRRLPNQLVELHDRYRALVRTDPGPSPRAAAVRRHPSRRRPTAPPTAAPAVAPAPAPAVTPAAEREAARRALFHPPRTPAQPAAGPTTTLGHRPATRALEGAMAGDLRVVLPHTRGDLARWSRLLANCLDTFADAVSAGRSTIIGFERDGEVVYAVELRPEHVIRQFTGRANRVPGDGDRAAVVSLLARNGVVDPAHPTNRPWFADLP